jgi:hypothetical protein
MEVNQILRRFQEAKRVKLAYENVFKDLTKYFLPYREDFVNFETLNQTTSNKKPRTELFNTEGANAATQLASTICQGLINQSQSWFEFGLGKTAGPVPIEIRQFLEAATYRVKAALDQTEANFYGQAQSFVTDLVVYGTACMYIEESSDPDCDVVFCTRPMAEIYVAKDHYGRTDTVFWKSNLTSTQIVDKWGDAAGEYTTNLAKVRPDEQLEVLHAVFKRNIAAINGIAVSSKKKYASIYILLKTNERLSEGGYDDMPYVVAGWEELSGQAYARSPAWVALPDVKRANAMQKTLIETSERMGNPPIMMPDDGVITQMRLAPGQPAIGALDPVTLQPRMQPFMVGGNMPVNLQMLQMVNQGIRDRFFVGVLSTYNPGVEKTATEVMEFKREESRLMGPNIGRIQAQMLEPIVERVKNILSRKKKLPPVPRELSNISIDLQFTSPLARLQGASDADAITRTINTMLPFIQTDPTLLDAINGEAAFAHIAEVNGVPASIIRSAKEVQAMKEQRAQQQQMQQTAEVMQQASQAQVNVAKANSLEGV